MFENSGFYAGDFTLIGGKYGGNETLAKIQDKTRQDNGYFTVFLIGLVSGDIKINVHSLFLYYTPFIRHASNSKIITHLVFGQSSDLWKTTA